MYHIKFTFFAYWRPFLFPTAGLSSRSRLRGKQGGRLYAGGGGYILPGRRKFGPRPGSVARALGVQSSASRQIITGSLSAELEPRRTMETQQFRDCVLLLLYHVCITPSLRLSSSLLCGSHCATAVAHQALPLMTAMRCI